MTLGSLQDDVRRALEDLRELAQGIHPAVLTDRGLLDAIEERAARSVLPIVIRVDSAMRGTRFPGEIEAAAYYFVTEGLANVLKHARASRVVMHVARSDRTLRVEVDDDGIGFDPSRATGSGLTGLRDRLEAVGGRLRVVSRPRHGTRLVADLPLSTASVVDA